ncbi:hypothetical protein [Hymenobacter rubripertinctus]|uniref:hypothetical protein n=1 Tax=Hymenobacter rubripertinctus TaxID=2029981 RepID=UPI0011C451DF|nr:hypothetical protein [Hymenobacter rubripertinctus]
MTTLLFLGWSEPFAAVAQTNDKQALNELYGDFAPADLTAATLLGVDASKVSKPSTVKALSASLVQPAKSFPKVSSGLALEVAPVLFFPNARALTGTESLKQYQNFGNALLRNWTLSGATVSDSAGTKVAGGLALTLYDGTDRLRVSKFVGKLSRELDAIQAGHDLSQLTRASSLRASAYADSLLAKNGIRQSLADKASATNAIYKTLNTRIATLGETPSDNAQIPTATEVEESQKKLLAQLQKTLDSLQTAHPSSTDGLLPKLAVADIMTGARLLALQGQLMYGSYRALNTALVTQTTSAVKKANEEFDRQTWNATIIQVGVGSIWASTAQEWSSLSANSTGFFARMALRPGIDSKGTGSKGKTPLGYALAHHALLVTTLRYNNYHDQPRFAERKPMAQTDSLRTQLWVGARWLIGSQYFRVSGEFSKRFLSYSQEAKDGANTAGQTLSTTWNSYAFGVEARLVEKLWLEFGLGKTYPQGQQRGQVFALSSIKYSIQNGQRFATR